MGCANKGNDASKQMQQAIALVKIYDDKEFSFD